MFLFNNIKNSFVKFEAKLNSIFAESHANLHIELIRHNLTVWLH